MSSFSKICILISLGFITSIAQNLWSLPQSSKQCKYIGHTSILVYPSSFPYYWGGAGGSSIGSSMQGRIHSISWGISQPIPEYNINYLAVGKLRFKSDHQYRNLTFGTDDIDSCTPFSLGTEDHISGFRVLYRDFVHGLYFYTKDGFSFGCVADISLDTLIDTGDVFVNNSYLSGFQMKTGGVIDAIRFWFTVCVYPTSEPTVDPTLEPTFIPTIDPTLEPTFIPTSIPTLEPTQMPTIYPTLIPTINPTVHPTLLTSNPTIDPTLEPTFIPTSIPTLEPTQMPTIYPTFIPTINPTVNPTLQTSNPTLYPTLPTLNPTLNPTHMPSSTPSIIQSIVPSIAPSISPSIAPTQLPSLSPSMSPTHPPSNAPTIVPSLSPSMNPSISPTFAPTIVPSLYPSLNPSISPSFAPTIVPSLYPSLNPSISPSLTPSVSPSVLPTNSPSLSPSLSSTNTSTILPSVNPSNTPTLAPSYSPTSKRKHLHFICDYNDDTFTLYGKFVTLFQYAAIMRNVTLSTIADKTHRATNYDETHINKYASWRKAGISYFEFCHVFSISLKDECPIYHHQANYIAIAMFEIVADTQINEYRDYLFDIMSTESFRIKLSQNMNLALDKILSSVDRKNFKVVKITVIDWENDESQDADVDSTNLQIPKLQLIIIVVIGIFVVIIICVVSSIYFRKRDQAQVQVQPEAAMHHGNMELINVLEYEVDDEKNEQEGNLPNGLDAQQHHVDDEKKQQENSIDDDNQLEGHHPIEQQQQPIAAAAYSSNINEWKCPMCATNNSHSSYLCKLCRWKRNHVIEGANVIDTVQ